MSRDGFKSGNALYWNNLANYRFASSPLATDDVGLGYEVGDLWLDTAGKNWYSCLDNTDDNAVWKRLSTTIPIDVDDGGTGTTTTFTEGSVVFAGASGVYSQDNTNLFWDNANNRLGIGINTPSKTLEVLGDSAFGDTIVNTYYSSAPVNICNSQASTLLTCLNLINEGGLTGAGSAIDFYTYTSVSTSTNAEGRLSFIDSGDYSGYFAFYTKATGSAANLLTERIRISSAGYLGIGATNPTYPLHVRTSSGNACFMIDAAAGGTAEAQWSMMSGASELRSFWRASDANYGLYHTGGYGTFFRYEYDTTSTSKLYLLETGGFLSIGVDDSETPTFSLQVHKGDNSLARFTNTGDSSSSAGAIVSLCSDDNAPMGSGHRLGFLGFGGSESTSTISYGFGISAITTQAWTTSANGCRLDFEGVVHATDASTRSTWMTLYNAKLGIGTTAPDKKLEINTGAATDGLRICYNDSNGSAAIYADFLLNSNGDLIITATGGDISLDNENLSTTGIITGNTLVSSTFTEGSVVFAGASGVCSQDNAKLFWDNTNNSLGIGTNTPGFLLDVTGTTTAGIACTNTNDSSADRSNGGYIRVVCNDGSAMESGHRLGGYGFLGYNGSSSTQGVVIDAYAYDDWSTGNYGSTLKIWQILTGASSIAATPSVILDGDGTWDVNGNLRGAGLVLDTDVGAGASGTVTFGKNYDSSKPASATSIRYLKIRISTTLHYISCYYEP